MNLQIVASSSFYWSPKGLQENLSIIFCGSLAFADAETSGKLMQSSRNSEISNLHKA